MKKMLKSTLALMAALAVVLSVPVVCSGDPEEEPTTKPPIIIIWDDGGSRN